MPSSVLGLVQGCRASPRVSIGRRTPSFPLSSSLGLHDWPGSACRLCLSATCLSPTDSPSWKSRFLASGGVNSFQPRLSCTFSFSAVSQFSENLLSKYSTRQSFLCLVRLEPSLIPTQHPPALKATTALTTVRSPGFQHFTRGRRAGISPGDTGDFSSDCSLRPQRSPH